MYRPAWPKNGCGIRKMTRLRIALKKLRQGVRGLTGEDAYDRYLAHLRDRHGEKNIAPLDRKAFYKQQQERKWSGIKRCC